MERVAEPDTRREVYEIGTGRESRYVGGGGLREGEKGRNRGGNTREGRVLPVELSSVSGCVELPTAFNEREREEEDATKEEQQRAKG